jgi:H+/Cl- antiporter ClcA
MAAAFGAAANAPLALTIMAVELLGASVLPHAALVCVVAWLLTGHRGIYGAQRLVRRKTGRRLARPVALRALRSDASAGPPR